MLSIVLALALVPSLARAQSGEDAQGLADSLSEGALDNDAFLPVAREAESLLARGDEGYAALLARGARAQDPQARRAWLEVLESWHQALARSAPGEGVSPRPWRGPPETSSPWADPDGTAGGAAEGLPARRTEGVEAALLRRLEALSAEARRLWSERFGPLGEDALAAAGRAADALSQVERLHPATSAAARAALARAELELESGRAAFALDWLERAGRHARLAAQAEIEQAVERRRAPALEIARASAAAPEVEREPWRRASDLSALTQVPLADLRARSRGYRPQPGKRFQSGLAWMGPSLAAIQSESSLVVLEPATGRIVCGFEPLVLLAQAGLSVTATEPPWESPGWPCAPACSGGRIVLAVQAEPRVLLCVSLSAPELFGGPSLPQLEWAIASGVIWAPGLGAPEPQALEGWPGGEIQPGPLAWDGCAFLQVHATEDEAPGTVRAHLVALDLATGRVRWSRMLARGSALARSSLRFLAAAPVSTAAQPLARVGDRIFAGTHLGAAALVEACDGRLDWTFKNRRRTPPQAGWSGQTPVVFESPLGVAFAPVDSDRLYWLRGAPPLEGQGLLLQPPQAIGDAEVLAESDARGALVLTRSGRERAVCEWDAESGAVSEAAHLGARESFTGTAAASSERAILATDRGVYLLDRTRDLYLLDFEPFPAAVPAPGGQVVARGDRVLVLGPYAAWILEAR